MSGSTVFNIKSSIFDRERELVLDKELLTFDNKDRIGVPPAKILKQEIVAFRFGVRWIKGYMFVIGRVYCIDINSSLGEVIKIRLKSLYGINKEKLAQKFSKILSTLYDIYFDDLIWKYLKQYEDLQDFEILGTTVRQDGLLIGPKAIHIAWEDVGIKSYHTYFTVFSISDPTVYKAFEYLNDWNTGVLYSVTSMILNNKGSEEPVSPTQTDFR